LRQPEPCRRLTVLPFDHDVSAERKMRIVSRLPCANVRPSTCMPPLCSLITHSIVNPLISEKATRDRCARFLLQNNCILLASPLWSGRSLFQSDPL
jgi:hypothetical protein